MESLDRLKVLLRTPSEPVPMAARVRSTLDWNASVEAARFPELADWYGDAAAFYINLLKDANQPEEQSCD